MIIHLFTVYDSKAEVYMQPFSFDRRGQAIRSFEDTCNDPSHQFFKHAEDFTLFELGSFEVTSASFLLHQTPVSLGKAIEYRKKLDIKV